MCTFCIFQSTECESSDAKKKEFSVSEFSGCVVLRFMISSLVLWVGENREQLDEVAYLLGGLASTESLLVQRSSALKLLQLIQNPKTCFLIRANNGFQQIFQLFTESDDEVHRLSFVYRLILALYPNADSLAGCCPDCCQRVPWYSNIKQFAIHFMHIFQ